MPRSHRLPTQCETCRFWQPDDYPEDTVLGECRIAAPEFNPLPVEAEDERLLAGLPRRPWPLTESRDWCARWQGPYLDEVWARRETAAAARPVS